MRILLKISLFLLLLLIFSGCEGNNSHTNPDYRLVSETYTGNDLDLYHGMYMPGDSNVTYTYDAENRLASMVFTNTPYYSIAIYPSIDQIETFVFEYQTDSLGRLQERTIYKPGTNGSKMATDITTLGYEDDQKVQVVQKNDWLCDGSLDKVETHYFDAHGHLERLTIDWNAINFYTFYPDIAGSYYYSTSSFLVNLTGFLEPADGTTDVTADYQYSVDGTLQSYAVVFDTPDTDENVSLLYNDLGQLTDVNKSYENIHYEYDLFGNLLNKTRYLSDGTLADTYEYSYSADGLLASKKYTDYLDENNTISTSSYTYDDRGNMIKMESDFETLTFTYDFSYEQRGLTRTIREYNIDYALYELSYDENDNLTRVVYYDNINLTPTKTSTYTWEKVQ